MTVTSTVNSIFQAEPAAFVDALDYESAGQTSWVHSIDDRARIGVSWFPIPPTCRRSYAPAPAFTFVDRSSGEREAIAPMYGVDLNGVYLPRYLPGQETDAKRAARCIRVDFDMGANIYAPDLRDNSSDVIRFNPRIIIPSCRTIVRLGGFGVPLEMIIGASLVEFVCLGALAESFFLQRIRHLSWVPEDTWVPMAKMMGSIVYSMTEVAGSHGALDAAAIMRYTGVWGQAYIKRPGVYDECVISEYVTANIDSMRELAKRALTREHFQDPSRVQSHKPIRRVRA